MKVRTLLAAATVAATTLVPISATSAQASADMPVVRSQSRTVLAGGSRIILRTAGGGIASCGIAAPYVRNHVAGLLTAGHCTAGSRIGRDRVHSASGRHNVGIVTRRSWGAGPDAAFIDKPWAVTIRKAVYSGSVGSRHTLPLAGSFRPRVSTARNVCLAGAQFGTHCGYRVTSTMAGGVVVSGRRVKPVWVARRPGRCVNGQGDSGSTLYTVVGGKAYIMGVQSLLWNDQSHGCYVLFASIVDVNRVLGGHVPGIVK